jgi:hypothetical protein
MGRACSARGEDEKCIRNFDWESCLEYVRIGVTWLREEADVGLL